MQCCRSHESSLLRLASVALFTATCLLAGCGSGDSGIPAPLFTKQDPACLTCHEGIEAIHPQTKIACTDCHGGDHTQTNKMLAHVQSTLPVIMDKTTAPLDYDLPYQRFVNPSNLRVVKDTCGTCHTPHVGWVMKSLMATGAGHYAGGLYANGVTDSKTPVYGNFAVTDEDGSVPEADGAVPFLLDLITYDASLDQDRFATHYRAVPGQVCARCHLWSRGKGYRGAVGADGTYRADGCAACHMPYANDGLSLSADTAVDHAEQGHPRYHRITDAVATEQCLHCHHRGARIGLSFTGRSQMPPDLPSGPGVAGTTDEKFNGSYHYADPLTNPPDLHGQRGLHCIDCHTQAGIMGDGNIYGHMDQATKIECRTCHGLPSAAGSLVDKDGKALTHVSTLPSGDRILTSKVDAAEHRIPQLFQIVDPASGYYVPRAARAMNHNHLKAEGGLECYACHTAWVPNCFGCHFERDEQLIGTNLITRESEVGKAATANKMFLSMKHFSMGLNAQGKGSPYIVGCQPIADVTSSDGSKKLDLVMPETVNGLSGLALQPVHAHTITAYGGVRTCVECHRSPPSLGLGSGNYAVGRSHAYVAAQDGIRVYERKNELSAPNLLTTLPCARPLAMATLPNGVTGRADFLYTASGTDGVYIFDMRGTLPPPSVARIAGIDAIDVSRVARYLYVSVRDVGVSIYDTQTPDQPTFVTTLPIPSVERAVPWGIHLFVAAGPAGLVILDISDHAMPGLVGTLPGINARDVQLYAHHQAGSAFAARAYVADPDYGVRIVDLLPEYSNPLLVGGLPLVGAVGLDTYTRYVIAEGTTPSREHDYLYVAAGSAGLRVFDITKPDDITQVGSLTTLGGVAMDVDVYSHMTPPGVDDYALIANDGVGLQIVSVGDPTAPSLLGPVAAPGALRVFVDVQQLDRYVDEQGVLLKENSHPGARAYNHAEIVRILKAALD